MSIKFRRLVLSGFIAYCLYFCTGLSSPAKAFETHDITPGQNPAVASDSKGGLHIVFVQDPNLHMKFNLNLCYSQSTNGGSIWTKPVKIAVAGKNYSPNIRTDIAIESNGAIDVIWGQEMYGDIAYIFFARSVDNGHTWSKPLNISKITDNSDDCNAPALAIGPDNSIHVVWSYTNHPTNPEALINGIYSASSADGGKTWHKNLPIKNNNTGPSTFDDPDIAVTTDGTVHLIWKQVIYGPHADKVYYMQKVGDSWSEPVVVSETIQPGCRPLICSSGKEKIYIIWTGGFHNGPDTSTCNLWYTVNDKSEQFSKPISIG